MTDAKPIHTIPELIDAVGSLAGAAKLIGMKHPQQLVACREAGKLPRRNAVPQRAALLAAGFDAPWSLWGIEAGELGGEKAA